MLAHEMHLLVKSLDTCHVSLRIVSEFYLLTAADVLCSPVEISHIDGASYFASYCVKTSLPSLYRLACSLWSKCKVYYLLSLHLSDDAENDIAAPFSVYWNTS